MKFFSFSSNQSVHSYNSLSGSKRWLNGHSMDSRSSENIRSLRIIILILVSVITLYLVIITSIGYQPKKIGSGSSSSTATTTYSVVGPHINPIDVNHEAANSSPDPSDKSNQQNDSEAE